MIYKVLQYIKSNNLFDDNSKLLLAVSGGIDSVVMLDVLYRLGYRNSVIAHCNFNLRGEESNSEEIFVKQLANKYGLEIYIKHFDTIGYAAKRKISIEMAARYLRYNWFEELRQNINAEKIVVAHNKNDFAETILLNLLRGTGIRGLRGILPQNGNVVRPLLNISRREIENYAQIHKLEYKNDSSNTSVKYRRNFVRHKVFPLLKEINPSFVDTLFEVGKRVSDANYLLENYLSNLKNDLITIDRNENILIEKEKIINEGSVAFVLEYFLRDYGFDYRQCEEIANTINNVGKYFETSSGYKLWIERKYLRIESIKNNKDKNSLYDKYIWNTPYKLPAGLPFRIEVKILSKTKDYNIKKDTSIAQLDFDKVDFPLIFRKWQAGDKFYPLGMTKMKKISDFLIDKKVELKEKNDIFVLSDKKGDILWVVGYQIDNRYKINQDTEKIIVIKKI